MRDEENPSIAWRDEDEKDWEKEGIILCPWDYSSSIKSVPISEIPQCCPYALEHMTQKEDEE